MLNTDLLYQEKKSTARCGLECSLPLVTDRRFSLKIGRDKTIGFMILHQSGVVIDFEIDGGQVLLKILNLL